MYEVDQIFRRKRGGGLSLAASIYRLKRVGTRVIWSQFYGRGADGPGQGREEHPDHHHPQPQPQHQGSSQIRQILFHDSIIVMARVVDPG